MMPQLLWLWIVLAAAQASAQPADSGVLLGVREDKGYGSYWVTHSNAGAMVVAAIPGVIVPHGSGFWRAGVTTVCEFDGTTNGTREMLWESPIDKAALVFQRAPCTNRKNARNCGVIRAEIRFVSPSVVSEGYEEGQTEECEPRGGRWIAVSHVRKLGQSEPLDISAFIGGSSDTVYRKALHEGHAQLKNSGMNCPPPEGEIDLTSWSITHAAGSWHPVANYSFGMSECEISYPLATSLSRSLTTDTDSLEFFRSAKQSTVELRDFFIAPNRTWGVAVLGTEGAQSLAVYEIKDGHLGHKLLDLPAGVRNVVSAQWALGAHVADWTSTLVAVTRTGEIKPRIVIDPKRARDAFQRE